MVLWGETLSKPQMKTSQWNLLSWVYGGREIHRTGRINRALVGLQLASHPSRWAGFGHVPLPDPHAPARISPHPSGSWWELPPCSPPRAVPGSCVKAARNFRLCAQRSLFMGKAEGSVWGWTITMCPEEFWAGEGERPQLSGKTNSQALPCQSRPCLADYEAVDVLLICTVSFFQGWIACQTATNASLQWSSTCFLVGYAGLKAWETLGCSHRDSALGPTALQEAASAQSMTMGTDI